MVEDKRGCWDDNGESEDDKKGWEDDNTYYSLIMDPRTLASTSPRMTILIIF